MRISNALLCFAILCSQWVAAQIFIDQPNINSLEASGAYRGVAIGDCNNDGMDDVYINRKDGPNLLYVNQGNFNFEEKGEEYDLDISGNSSGSIWFDLDNDGDQDLFIAGIFEECKIYIHEDGRYIDKSGIYLAPIVGNIQSVNVVDFDNDGYLDIYLARFLEENVLLRNHQGEYFLDYLSRSGISDKGKSMGAIFFDYDGDGDQDLYQTRDGDEGNVFFRNDSGYFTEVTQETGTGYKGQGMGVDAGDVNGDGLLDIYFSNLYDNVLYLQQDNHTFVEATDSNLSDRGMGWGTFIFDSDNKGNEDVFIANDSHFLVDDINYHNKLVMNRGDMKFFAPPMNPEFQNTYASYGASYADLDDDGRLDIVVSNAGSDHNQLFRNESVELNYISFDLQGVVSNRDAIGAKVIAYLDGRLMTKVITAGHSYLSQSQKRVHFGLGDNQNIDKVVIHWPSGIEQTIESPEINTIHSITEEKASLSRGELIWTEPPFPTQTDDVTIYFDAKEGNGGLQGYNGAVYVHAGVITDKSSSPTDWKFVQGTWGVANDAWRMTSEGDDVYSISYNITDFYGIPPGEIVRQMAFVFRSGDGSRAGRATDGSDIYLDVFEDAEALLVNIREPGDNQLYFPGDALPIALDLNKEATITISNNGEEIYSGRRISIDTTILVSELGKRDLTIIVEDGDDRQEIIRSYTVIEQSGIVENPPAGLSNGINYQPSSYIFQLRAPLKKHAFFLCPANDYTIDPDYRMKQSIDGTIFWIELPKSIFSENTTTYQYLVDGNIKIADPFARVVLDPWHDGSVPDDVMVELPAYPEGMTSGIVTAFDREDPSYEWQYADYERPEKTELIIYETLMRDFFHDRNYKSLIDTLDYLDRLGVNAIELMPISEFEANDSWGYNPSFHMAVDKYYGSRDQLKTFIDECHRRGIAVILDVVFNHAFSQSPLCQLYWDAGAFRPTTESPYLNVVARHPYNVGYDFNHQSTYTKEWVKQVLTHWIEEYQFDGFRFDLSKGLTQTNSGNNGSLMSRYDQSRIEILKDYADHIWSLDPESYVIMEHFADNDEEKVLSDYGMMMWGNVTHEYGQAAMGFRSDLDWSDYTSRGWNDPHLIAYMESHDEERMGYRLKNFGDRNASYDTRETATGMERIMAASVIYFSVPGPKMIWKWGELGYDHSINRCVNGSVSGNCRLDPKPILWNYFDEAPRKLLYNKLSDLFYLRNNYEVFHTRDFLFNDGNLFLKTVHLHSDDMDVVSLVNFRITNSDLNPKFPHTGTWYEYFSGDIIEVTDTQEKLTFLPGEYRIYLSEPVTPPGGYYSSTKATVAGSLDVYPNPVREGQKIQLELPKEIIPESLYLIMLDGRTTSLSYQNSGDVLFVETPRQLSGGIYTLVLQGKNSRFVSKIVILP